MSSSLETAYKSLSLPREQSLVMNDVSQGRKVLSTIKTLLSQCSSFRFFVAFVNQQGVVSLVESLIELEKRGVKGELLVSQYLNFTEPLALRTLLN